MECYLTIRMTEVAELKLGLDIGSTTIKCVVLDDENKLIYSTYERHYSQITEKIAELLSRVRREIDGAEQALVALSGDARRGEHLYSRHRRCHRAGR